MKVTLPGTRVLAEVIKLRILRRSSWIIQERPIFNNKCPYKNRGRFETHREKGNTKTGRDRSDVTTKQESKECQQPEKQKEESIL